MLLDQIFTKIIWISSTTLLPSTKWTVFVYEIDRSLLQTFLLRKLYETLPDSDSKYNEVSVQWTFPQKDFLKKENLENDTINQLYSV